MPEKEEITTPEPQQTTAPKPEYKYIDKVPLTQIIKQTVPAEFLPTPRLASIFGIILLIAIVPVLTQFPIGKILSGNIDADMTIEMGYPWHFLELKITSPETSNFLLFNLILNVILYLFVAYAINIIINFISKEHPSHGKLADKTKVYEDLKPSMASKVTKKIFEEEQPAPSPNS